MEGGREGDLNDPCKTPHAVFPFAAATEKATGATETRKTMMMMPSVESHSLFRVFRSFTIYNLPPLLLQLRRFLLRFSLPLSVRHGASRTRRGHPYMLSTCNFLYNVQIGCKNFGCFIATALNFTLSFLDVLHGLSSQEGESVNGNSSFIPAILSLLSFHFAAAPERRRRKMDAFSKVPNSLARTSQHLPLLQRKSRRQQIGRERCCLKEELSIFFIVPSLVQLFS